MVDTYVVRAVSGRPLLTGCHASRADARKALNALVVADNTVEHDRLGRPVNSKVWFPASAEDFVMREMKLTSDQYDMTLSLLVPPAWPMWEPQ